MWRTSACLPQRPLVAYSSRHSLPKCQHSVPGHSHRRLAAHLRPLPVVTLPQHVGRSTEVMLGSQAPCSLWEEAACSSAASSSIAAGGVSPARCAASGSTPLGASPISAANEAIRQVRYVHSKWTHHVLGVWAALVLIVVSMSAQAVLPGLRWVG
jgi:hypothetical protein